MLALGAAATLGCSERAAKSPDAAPPIDARVDAPVDAPPDAAPPIDAPDAQPPCNALVNIGQNITWQFVSEPRPTPTGGTILDGTYVLTSQISYDSFPGGFPMIGAETIEITGTVVQEVQADLVGGGGFPPIRQTWSLTVSDATHVVIQQNCAVLNPPVLNGYSATPTSVAFHSGDIVFTYRKP